MGRPCTAMDTQRVDNDDIILYIIIFVMYLPNFQDFDEDF